MGRNPLLNQLFFFFFFLSGFSFRGREGTISYSTLSHFHLLTNTQTFICNFAREMTISYFYHKILILNITYFKAAVSILMCFFNLSSPFMINFILLYFKHAKVVISLIKSKKKKKFSVISPSFSLASNGSFVDITFPLINLNFIVPHRLLLYIN